MTSPFQKVCVKQEYLDDFSRYSSQDFWDYELAIGDYHEDASTQTDSFTICKSAHYSVLSHGLVDSQQDLSEVPVSEIKTDCFESPPMRKTNHCHRRSKTPNTIRLLMEKHRENERLRHHCLNKQLHMICKIVPGFAEEGKETKVVMMQRIISYIAYLENSIKYLSSELEMEPSPSVYLLTKGVKDMDWSSLWDRECVPMNSEDSRDSEVSTMSMSRRLKLSSPTIDSTTDCASQESLPTSSYSIPTSQTDSQMSDGSVKIEFGAGDDIPKVGDVDWVLSLESNVQDHFDSIFGGLTFDQSTFQVTPPSFEGGLTDMETLEVEWLGSPDKCLKTGKVENFGIKLDNEFLEEPVSEFSHADIVSPDQVLPQTSIKPKIYVPNHRSRNQQPNCCFGEFPQNDIVGNISYDASSRDDCQVVPHSSKRKQLTPKRTPFINMVNWSDMPDGIKHEALIEVEDCRYDMKSDIPMPSNFLEVKSSFEEENEEDPKEALNSIREKVLLEASKVAASSKLDLRKSSWLNGFMMYSRVQRRKFIRENPGVHTAQISKMMGQAWREMSSEQQHLYKEHAKLCSQELQHVLDSKFASLDGHRLS